VNRLARAGALPGAAIAAASTLVVSLPSAPGLAGVAGLLLTAGSALAVGLASWIAVPQLMVAVVPALLPIPLVSYVFPWEVALYALAVVVALHAWRRRESWLWRLGDVECWQLLFTGWALFTVFWSSTSLYYLLGVRRLLTGVVALWIATRLPHIASRRWFDMGLVLAAAGIASAAIGHSLTTGFSEQQALLHRSQVTHLGWGTANYVATLLLLLGPSLFRLALRGTRLERALAAVAFALATVVQFVVASRAATVLFILGTIVQLVHATRRFRLVAGLAAAAIVAALVVSPLGAGLILRMTSLRDLGSLTIRIWYFREGTSRLFEHLPWGMGLGQGYANPDRLQGIDPHNYWLLVGGDLGIPGLLLWAGVLVAMIRGWLAVRSDAKSRELAFTILLTIALGNLHTLVEPTFQGVHYQLLFPWIVCGTLAYVKQPLTSVAQDRARVADAMPAPSRA
jgi:hypothetical protein